MSETVIPKEIRILQLEELIKKYQEAFFNGEVEISDGEFDMLWDELEILDPENSLIKKVAGKKGSEKPKRKNNPKRRNELERRIEKYQKSYFKGEVEIADTEYDILLNELMGIDPNSHLLTKISGTKEELIKKDVSELSEAEIKLFEEELFWRRPGNCLIWEADEIDNSENFSKVIESKLWQESFYKAKKERINELEESIKKFENFFYKDEYISGSEYDVLWGYVTRLLRLEVDSPLLKSINGLWDRVEDLDDGRYRIKQKNIVLKKISWDSIDHNSSEQLRRQKSAHDKKLVPISIDNEAKRGLFSGTSRNYNVTLYNCECVDFSMRGQLFPCKHMYRLAHELGITNFYEIISANVDRKIGIADLVREALE